MASAEVPVYYELSWAILSTIGLTNMCFGLMVVGIVGFSPIVLVPFIVSAACALANGMCYYAFYADYPIVNAAVASAFADLAWLIQEAGLSFYSYVILTRVLRNRARLLFTCLFWGLVAIIGAIRAVILITRVRFILGGSSEVVLQSTVDNLHVGYFATIALVECVSSAFLLRTFNSARKISVKAAIRAGLFSYLMRSTEIRLALLALIGITRAITYSSQNSAQAATSVASQLDRFAYTLECVFPVVMFIDILASRLVFANDVYASSSHSRGGRSANRGPRQFTQNGDDDDVHMYPMPNVERHIEVKGGQERPQRTSSQEYIMSDGSTSRAGTDIEEAATQGLAKKAGTINKTVEFKVFEARAEGTLRRDV